MTNTHAERLARLNVLNLRRTQGNWKAHRYNPSNIGYSDKGVWGVHSDLRGARRSKIKGTAVACGIAVNAEATARFIEAAPEAIALCNDLAADNERLRALLEECEGVLTYYRRVDNYMAQLADDGRFDFRNTDIHKDGGSHAREMLTKLHAAGIGGK